MDSLVVTKAVSLTPIVVFIEISVGIITFTNDQPHFRLLPAPRLRSQQVTNAIQFLSHIPHPTNTSQLHYQKQVPFAIVTAATKTSVAIKFSIPEHAFITWTLPLPYVSAGTGVALLLLASKIKNKTKVTFRLKEAAASVVRVRKGHPREERVRRRRATRRRRKAGRR